MRQMIVRDLRPATDPFTIDFITRRIRSVAARQKSKASIYCDTFSGTCGLSNYLQGQFLRAKITGVNPALEILKKFHLHSAREKRNIVFV